MSVLASFKDLCVDVVDPVLMGPFWAGVLALDLRTREDGMTFLVGPTDHHTVWLNRVPEPVTVKQRVHLDVHVAATADVLALGATAVDTESFRWDLLRDPEGGELCTFTRAEVPAYRLYEVVVDAADPMAIGGWWAEVLGVPLHEDDDEDGHFAYLEGVPGMPFESMVFGPVPEPKTVKNRVHWDVDTASVEGLVGHGAEVLRRPDDEISWTVLADPEGNEFCAFVDDGGPE